MVLKVGDRAKQTSTTTGTGTLTLNGTASSGFVTFRTYLETGDTTYYVIEDGSDFEVGTGTFTRGGETDGTADTITRASDDIVFSSSNSNNRVSWGSGTRNVFISNPGEKTVLYNNTGNSSSLKSTEVALNNNDQNNLYVGFKGGEDGDYFSGITALNETKATADVNGAVSNYTIINIDNLQFSNGSALQNYMTVTGKGIRPGTFITGGNLSTQVYLNIPATLADNTQLTFVGRAGSGNYSFGGGGDRITTGALNTLVGPATGAKLTSGSYNTVVGTSAMPYNETGIGNTVMGYRTAESLGNGDDYCTAIGYMANTSIDYATAVGYQAQVTGMYSTAIGYGSSASGYYAVAIGLTAQATATSAIAMGYYARAKGSYNISLGYYAGYNSSGNTYDILIGRGAGQYSYGDYNIVIGNFSFMYTGSSANSDYNIALGYQTLQGDTSMTGARAHNIALGYQSTRYIHDGTHNIAMGQESLRGYSSSVGVQGDYNIALGYQVMRQASASAVVTASRNVAIGYRVLTAIQTGNNNIAMGYDTGLALTTGGANVIIGYEAGDLLTSGSGNVLIGYKSDVSDATHHGRLAIQGYDGSTANPIKWIDGDQGGVTLYHNSGGTPTAKASVTSAGLTVTGSLSTGTVTIPAVSNDWTITFNGNNLRFNYAGTPKMQLDTNGNLIVVGDITTDGTIS